MSKYMHVSLLLFLYLASGTAWSGPNISYAWWVTAEFEPSGDSVWTIPIKNLNESWVAARLLEISDVPEDTGSDKVREQMQEYALAFQVAADFDNDGEVERAGVGVFEAEDGTRGSFLLIVDQSGGVEFIEVTNHEPRFGVIKVENDGLSHWYCLECGHYFAVKAIGRNMYKLIEPEPYG